MNVEVVMFDLLLQRLGLHDGGTSYFGMTSGSQTSYDIAHHIIIVRLFGT